MGKYKDNTRNVEYLNDDETEENTGDVYDTDDS